MQAEQLKERINKIEQCADEALQCVQQGSAPADLRQSVDTLHRQAQQALQACNSQQQMGQDGMEQTVAQLEQSGDKAVQACRSAGANVDQKTQQAVKRAHDEISGLKKQLQMG